MKRLLNENITAEAYHFTTLPGLLGIMRSNTFTLKNAFSVAADRECQPDNYPYFLSLTNSYSNAIGYSASQNTGVGTNGQNIKSSSDLAPINDKNNSNIKNIENEPLDNEEPKVKEFRIHTSSGPFVLNNVTKDEIRQALKEKFPNIKDEAIETLVNNEKNYPSEKSIAESYVDETGPSKKILDLLRAKYQGQDPYELYNKGYRGKDGEDEKINVLISPTEKEQGVSNMMPKAEVTNGPEQRIPDSHHSFNKLGKYGIAPVRMETPPQDSQRPDFKLIDGSFVWDKNHDSNRNQISKNNETEERVFSRNSQIPNAYDYIDRIDILFPFSLSVFKNLLNEESENNMTDDSVIGCQRKNTLMEMNVRITVNGNKFNEKYKGGPIDYLFTTYKLSFGHSPVTLSTLNEGKNSKKIYTEIINYINAIFDSLDVHRKVYDKEEKKYKDKVIRNGWLDKIYIYTDVSSFNFKSKKKNKGINGSIIKQYLPSSFNFDYTPIINPSHIITIGKFLFWAAFNISKSSQEVEKKLKEFSSYFNNIDVKIKKDKKNITGILSLGSLLYEEIEKGKSSLWKNFAKGNKLNLSQDFQKIYGIFQGNLKEIWVILDKIIMASHRNTDNEGSLNQKLSTWLSNLDIWRENNNNFQKKISLRENDIEYMVKESLKKILSESDL